MKIKYSTVLIAVILLFTACHLDRNKGLGSEDNPVKLGFMPAPDKPGMEADTETIAAELIKTSGLNVRPIIANDIITLIDGLKTKQFDAAFLSSLGYLLAHDWAKADAVMQIRGIDGNMVYRSAIITNVDKGINSLGDLNGKNIAYTDSFSTSGYLMPFALFVEKSIKPAKTEFLGSYNDVVEAVYNGTVDAGAIYYAEPDPYGRVNDARARLIDKHPDMLKKVVIVALTDTVPTMPIVFRRDLPEDAAKKLAAGIKDLGNDPAAISALRNLYGATGIVEADQESFKKIEKTLQGIGKNVQEVVPGGVTFYQKHVWEYAPEY